MAGAANRATVATYRNLLIGLWLLKSNRSIHYSQDVPGTRWGDAIARLLADRGWTQRQLADAASVRPNTITNLLKHGKDADTATLARVAAAFDVDVSELFLTREQSVVLHAHQESRIDQLRDLVVREVSATVTRLVERELASGVRKVPFLAITAAPPAKRARRRQVKR